MAQQTPGSGKYETILARCQGLAPVPTAVAHPCEASALAAAVEAYQLKLIVPLLVGPADKIAETAREAKIDLGKLEIVDAPHSSAAAAKAVQLVREGKAEILMKGSLHTDELMGAVVSRENGLLDGPLAFDNAISKEAAQTKGIQSSVAGDPDILLAPDLEAGNILAKQLTFLANADSAGMVLGARVPIILTSRADSVRSRIASCAVAVLVAHARRKKP